MRALAWLVACLPYRSLALLGALIGAFVGSVLRVRRRHVQACLARAGFDEPGKLARRMYRSLGVGLFELLWLAGRPPAALDDLFVVDEVAGARVSELIARGEGIVIATAHTGNWDLCACAAARWFSRREGALELAVITKRLSWRALDRYWQGLRAARGVALVDARGALAKARRALAKGQAVAMMIDQAPERSAGVTRAVFLGAEALHDLAPALIAARARAPLALVLSHRLPDGRHKVELVDVIEPAELGKGKDAIVEATRRLASGLERFVRAHPEQWLWLHRRWKGATVGAKVRSGPEPAP